MIGEAPAKIMRAAGLGCLFAVYELLCCFFTALAFACNVPVCYKHMSLLACCRPHERAGLHIASNACCHHRSGGTGVFCASTCR